MTIAHLLGALKVDLQQHVAARRAGRAKACRSARPGTRPTRGRRRLSTISSKVGPVHET